MTPGAISSTSLTAISSNAFNSDAKYSPFTKAGLVQRLDAERIAGSDDALWCSENECEHSVQPGDPARLVGLEKMQNRLAVAVRFERVFAKYRAQIGVVVDLALGNKNIVIAADRLSAALRANDRKAAVRHHGWHVRGAPYLQPVRPTMRDLLDHSSSQNRIVKLPQANESAHRHNSSLAAVCRGTPINSEIAGD